MDLDTVAEKLDSWGERAVAMLPNIVLALLVLLVFLFIARLARRLVRKLSQRISSNRAVGNLFALLTYIGILLIGTAIALQILNLDGAATSVLAGAGIAGVALGFAFQDIAANFISGIVLAVQRPFKIGDLVETHEVFGIIRHINLRSTEIETLEGQMVHIPNKDILLNPLVDFSHRSSRRVDLAVGVAYGSDLEKVKKVALKAVNGLDGINEKKPIDFYYTEFGDSSINFTVRFWIPFKKEPDFLELRSNAIIAIKKAFDKEGITIPFPIRTLEAGPHLLKELKK